MEKSWGIFAIEEEVERVKDIIEKEGLEIFEVRKLTFWERLTYCKDPILFWNNPWVIMFKASRLQYKVLIFKNRMKLVM